MFLFCFPHQSDVWALGCCVYEMSTLKHAFNARDMNSLVYRIVEGKVGVIFFFSYYQTLNLNLNLHCYIFVNRLMGWSYKYSL